MATKTHRADFEKDLKDFGFVKQGRNLVLCGDFCCVIANFQGSAYGENYYVNIGIHIKEIAAAEPEEELAFHLSGRLGSLVPGHADYSPYSLDRLSHEAAWDDVEFQSLLKKAKARVLMIVNEIDSKEKLKGFVESEAARNFLVSAELRDWMKKYEHKEA